MANVSLTVNPDVIDLKIGESATLNITTDLDNDLDVVSDDQSGTVDIIKNNGIFTVTAVKAGIAELTVTAMDADSDTAQASVMINVIEEIIDTPDDEGNTNTDKWTDREVQSAIRASKPFKDKFKELMINAPIEYVSLIAVLSMFNKDTSILHGTNNSPEYISGHIFNIYKVMVSSLEKSVIDNKIIKFENVLEIIQCHFVEYADDGFSYNALTRYMNLWDAKASIWNVVKNDTHTHNVLAKIISTLADPNTREANKAVVDVSELLNDDTVSLSEELKSNIIDYYS